ncbi:hypothetical protein RJ640_015215 [Escallonia rubra]|uniref:Uncharacterized protein n=1 Tax=Escallonia rubra TaxID=112253 RepID=A0AA88RHS1_9ASTE|nr:hypothetical protein RJ640_015215 [Escallonia rubra]
MSNGLELNALTDPQRVRTPAITEYWKPLADDMDASADIEAEYHHKTNRFTEYGIEGVVPLELLPPDVRSKYQAKPSDRSKRAKKEETRSSANQAEENQIATPASEIDGEGSRVDLDTPIAPMDTDAPMATGTISQGGTPTPDEHQKQSSDTDAGPEAGQVEADGELEAGMIDGETDADVDLVAVG